jgi:hypothetical protein
MFQGEEVALDISPVSGLKLPTFFEDLGKKCVNALNEAKKADYHLDNLAAYIAY